MIGSKHTPGPWIVNGPTICAAPNDAAPTGYQLMHILNPYAGAIGAASRVSANAALVAAAPDMLQSLQRLINAIDRLPGNNPLDGLADEARAIIARATGV